MCTHGIFLSSLLNHVPKKLIRTNKKGKWKECLESKYGTEQDGNHTPLKHQSWWWRDLVKVCRQGGGEGWIKKEVSWKVGKRDQARFWEDIWTGNASLKALFPRLFSLSLHQGQTVGEVGMWEESEWQWNLRWRRNRFEWEVPLVTELGMLISRVTMKKDEQDKQVWRRDESGNFTVKSAYKCLEEPVGGTQISSFGYLWKTKAFPNVLITAWRVLLGRLPTRECLSKRGVTVNTTECALCQTKEETCQHLFICKYAVRVWDLCFRWVGIWSAQHNNLRTNFEGFPLPQHSNFVDVEEVFHNAQLKSWLWLKHKENNFCYSYAEWVMNR